MYKRQIEGYTIHEESRTQTVVINPNDTQTLPVYNDPIGCLLYTSIVIGGTPS